MAHQYHYTHKSANKKTGPIPVTTTSEDSCPPSCPLKGKGCYAGLGHLGMHWRRVSSGDRGGTLDELCDHVKALPKGQLWRHNQAGDLPGDGEYIDIDALSKIVTANSGKRGFTYTHYPMNMVNHVSIQAANQAGFTINISTETFEDADFYHSQGFPVVTLLPSDQTENVTTKRGNTVVVCPATQSDKVTCKSCKLCANHSRNTIVGFPVHGSQKGKINVSV